MKIGWARPKFTAYNLETSENKLCYISGLPSGGGAGGGPQSFSPAPEVYRALASISADSLRGNLSFIASDLLEGRDTPSRGLDIATLYIAAQFRRAGLEPAGDDGYFQTAKMLRVAQAAEGFELRMQSGSRTLTVSRDQTTVVSQQPLELSGAPVYKVAVEGKVVVLDPPARPLSAGCVSRNGG
jgi:hypothetical protein